MAIKGVASPLDYLLGRGEIYFSTNLDADGRPKEFRSLGHAEAFTVTLEAETLEHFSKLLGTGNKDREITISQSMGFGFQLSEQDPDNTALFFSGTATDVAQTGATVTTVAGDDNVIVSGLGRWYDIYQTQAPTEYPEIGGTRVYRLSAVSVKDTTLGTTYDINDDYLLDLEMGRIFIVDGGAIGSTDPLCVSFTYATLTISEIRAMLSAKIEGVLKFVSRNANKSGNGSEVEYTFHQASVTPDGDLALIGDELAVLPMKGSAEPNAVVSPNSPTLTIRQLSA
jgi:hypothetical protein